LIGLLLSAASPVLAQQPATALQRCGTDVGNLAVRADELAEQLDQARLKISELQKQVEDEKAAKTKDKE